MVYQTDEKNCGEAVVREVLSRLFKEEGFKTLRLTQDCSTFAGMKTELLLHGVNYVGVELHDLGEVKKKDLPMIVQVVRGNYRHFIVVSKIMKKKVSILDPQFGEYTLPLEEFLDEFTNKALIFHSKSSKPYVERIRL